MVPRGHGRFPSEFPPLGIRGSEGEASEIAPFGRWPSVERDVAALRRIDYLPGARLSTISPAVPAADSPALVSSRFHVLSFRYPGTLRAHAPRGQHLASGLAHFVGSTIQGLGRPLSARRSEAPEPDSHLGSKYSRGKLTRLRPRVQAPGPSGNTSNLTGVDGPGRRVSGGSAPSMRSRRRRPSALPHAQPTTRKAPGSTGASRGQPGGHQLPGGRSSSSSSTGSSRTFTFTHLLSSLEGLRRPRGVPSGS